MKSAFAIQASPQQEEKVHGSYSAIPDNPSVTLTKRPMIAGNLWLYGGVRATIIYLQNLCSPDHCATAQGGLHGVLMWGRRGYPEN